MIYFPIISWYYSGVNSKKYNPAIDILRFISILAVVLIHTTTRTLEINKLSVTDVPWTLFLNQVSRFAVPLFFMISGFVLELSNSANINYFQYLKKRLSRIFIPYVFWSAIYYYFVYTHHNISFVHALAIGSSSYQLYFIPTILIFYLIFPLISRLYNILCNKWSMLALGVIQVIILAQDYYIHPLTFQYPVNIALLNFYVFLLGIVASKHQESLVNFIKKWKLLLIPATIVSAFFVFFQGDTLYLGTHNYYVFYSQWRPSVLIYTVLLGSTFYYLFSKNFFHLRIIQAISKLSFFVFFIHVIVLELLWYKAGIFLFQANPQITRQFWYDPLFFLIVAGFSFGVAYAVHRIPYLSKITG